MLIVAAKLLASVPANVADPKATEAAGKPTFYDVNALIDEAKGYSANRSRVRLRPPRTAPAFVTTSISATV